MTSNLLELIFFRKIVTFKTEICNKMNNNDDNKCNCVHSS
jgi:hypothetical protein